MRILLVDDDYAICELTAGKLKAYEKHPIADITCAFSGEEALAKLKQIPYDVLITDICMEQMDGLELIQQAKEIQPSIICIVISAFDTFAYAKRGIQLGVLDFWVKPYTEDKLYESVDKIFHYYNNARRKHNDMLDMALHAAIVSDNKTLDEVFVGEEGYLPGKNARIICWRKNGAYRDKMDGAWAYHPKDKNYVVLICDRDEPDLEQRIFKQLCTHLKQTIGVSQPGTNIAALYSQATQALRSGWIWNSPKIIQYLEKTDQTVADQARKLIRKSLTASPDTLLGEIRHLENSMDVSCVSKLIEDVFWGIAEQIEQLTGTGQTIHAKKALTEGGGMGWYPPVKRLLSDLELARSQKRSKLIHNPIAWSKDYVAAHLSEEIDMAVISNKLNMSYPYFSKFFRKQTGYTFSEYVLEQRMREACRLLLEGERVTEVARKVGYQNANNFTRAFKRMYSIAPNMFRTDQQDKQ